MNEKRDTSRPLVSVIIPYYNRASTIDETIQSLQQQTFTNFEVILVNDGSPEQESVDKLEHLDTAGLNFTLINQKNAGVAAARNNGIKKSQGTYIICLDSDDMLEPTYIEKCLLVQESNGGVELATTDERFFGVQNHIYKQSDYNPLHLLDNNMVTTAAMFTREGFDAVGGYKPDIGYEDWEFWINLAEHGYWGRNIPEPLFNYRTAVSSRYTEDKSKHRVNMKKIRELHPNYMTQVKRLKRQKYFNPQFISNDSLFVNLDNPESYKPEKQGSKNVLMTLATMTFGGVETLVYNYCREVKDDFNITFMTGLQLEHQWEYKFKEITPNIYHLPNLFDDPDLYVEFMSNYITIKHIDTLHIIHNGFVFEMLPELKKRHPQLKIIVTMFNDRVEDYVAKSIKYKNYVDIYTTDNAAVSKSFRAKLGPEKLIEVIPNGINCFDEFNRDLFDREKTRADLGINRDDLAVFFVGRLSVEKNPDVFVAAAQKVLKSKQSHNVKFFVIGDGPMREEIEKAIKSVKSDNITYLGYQSQVAEYLVAADIFVLPSAIEGFPLSILEAMAMRVAVIASDVGAVSDVVESGVDGFVVTAGSADEITKAINDLAADPKLLEDVKTKGRKKVEKKYSNVALGDAYENLYKRFSK